MVRICPFLLPRSRPLKQQQIVNRDDDDLRPDQGELTFSSKKGKITTLEQSHVWHSASLSILEKVLEQCPVATIQ